MTLCKLGLVVHLYAWKVELSTKLGWKHSIQMCRVVSGTTYRIHGKVLL
jgi:hypothetical protein